jgi:small multidrug resistance pump
LTSIIITLPTTKEGFLKLLSLEIVPLFMVKNTWMKTTLRLAAVYNVIWGAWVVLVPHHFFEITGMEAMIHPTIWQGMGMIVGVYGLGYWFASYDPIRHWPIILVGFLGKIFGPLGFLMNYFFLQSVPFEFSYTLYTNDLIWWIPFFLILKAVHDTTNWKLTA